MSNHNQHLIVRQFMDIEMDSTKDSFQLQQELSQLYWQKMVPILEKLLDKYERKGEIIQLEKLELDLGTMDSNELESVFLKRFAEEMETALVKNISISSLVHPSIPVAQNHFNQWLYFLSHGTMPWFYKNDEAFSEETVLMRLKKSGEARAQLTQLLKKEQVALQRLVRQFDGQFSNDLMAIFTNKSQADWLAWQKEFSWFLAECPSDILKDVWLPIRKSAFKISELFWLSAISLTIIFEKKWPAERLLTAIVKPVLTTTVLQKKEVFKQFLKKNQGKMPLLSPVLIKWVEENAVVAVQHSANEKLEKPLNLIDKKDELTSTNLSNKASNKSKKPAIANRELKADFDKNAIKNQQASHLENQEKIAKDNLSALETKTNAAKEKLEKNRLNQQKTTAQKDQKSTIKPVPPMEAEQFSDKLVSLLSNEMLPDANVPQADFSDLKDGQYWYLNNAGVVLLGAFLPHLFASLDLLNNQQFKSPMAQQQAVYLIEYIATGATELPEHQLLLPKFICGMPFDVPLSKAIILTKKQQTETENMMQAAIQHWGALGKVSTDALREGFLHRDGKLEKKESGWSLEIEKKTLDILLNQLPWNMSVLKFPWMKDRLIVNWN